MTKGLLARKRGKGLSYCLLHKRAINSWRKARPEAQVKCTVKLRNGNQSEQKCRRFVKDTRILCKDV